MTDLTFVPAVELLRLYRARKASPLEVMQAILARIDTVNPRVNAVVTLARESALREARRATAALRRGAALPPLFGIPVGIKDVTPTRGLRTTYGSKLFEDHVPDEDALVVERLRAAGAIVIGKTNTPEFAFGPNTVNAVFGATRNPWNLAMTAGGSSGGSAAALATGMCPLAEGTDLGGSLRGPASHCGVVGFRTTPGLIPRYPSTLAWDSYSVEGPMARTIADTALMLSAMAGADDRSPISYDADTREFAKAVKAPAVKGWRIAWTPDLGGLVQVDREVGAVFEGAVGAFRSLGARMEVASPDMSDVPEIVRLSRGLLMVARHADKLPEHRAVLQEGLVHRAGTRPVPARDRQGRDPAHPAVAARAGVPADSRSLDHPDLRHAALPAGAAARAPDRRAARGQGDAAVVPDLRVLGARVAGDLHPLRLHERRPPGRAPDRGQAPRRGGGAARGRRLRGGPALGGRATAGRRIVRRPITVPRFFPARRVRAPAARWILAYCRKFDGITSRDPCESFR
jgi:amidase